MAFNAAGADTAASLPISSLRQVPAVIFLADSGH